MHNFRKLELFHGYHDFFQSNKYLQTATNFYTVTNYALYKKKIYRLSSQYSNKFRGILMDSDDAAVKMAYALRRTGKENEIKTCGFGAQLHGLDSMIKTGLVVTGDINRYALFHAALTNAMRDYPKLIKREKQKIHIPGAYYHQFNAMDVLSKTKKYSIHQIITEK